MPKNKQPSSSTTPSEKPLDQEGFLALVTMQARRIALEGGSFGAFAKQVNDAMTKGLHGIPLKGLARATAARPSLPERAKDDFTHRRSA